MRRRLLTTLLIVLALLPGSLQAQGLPRNVPRPSPLDIAAAMAPCVQQMDTLPTRIEGDLYVASMTFEGERALYLVRLNPHAGVSTVPETVWMQDDPVDPPMVLHLENAELASTPGFRGHLVGCFGEAMEPHLPSS